VRHDRAPQAPRPATAVHRAGLSVPDPPRAVPTAPTSHTYRKVAIVSTTNLRTAVEITTAVAAQQVAGTLASLDGYGVLTLATTDSLLADLAAAEEHSDDDKARAEVAMAAGIRAHTLLVLVKACLRALADPDDNGQLDPDLVEAVIAADPVVTESVRKALHDSIAAPGDAALHFALLGELRRAQQAATDTTQVPDTIPDDWTGGGLP